MRQGQQSYTPAAKGHASSVRAVIAATPLHPVARQTIPVQDQIRAQDLIRAHHGVPPCCGNQTADPSTRICVRRKMQVFGHEHHRVPQPACHNERATASFGWRQSKLAPTPRSRINCIFSRRLNTPVTLLFCWRTSVANGSQSANGAHCCTPLTAVCPSDDAEWQQRSRWQPSSARPWTASGSRPSDCSYIQAPPEPRAWISASKP